MGLTLAQFKAFTTVAKSQLVIDEIRKDGPLLNILPFTDNGGMIQGKWTYQYTRDDVMAVATTRLVNEEYTPANVTAATPITTDLSIMGKSYTLDRVMADSPVAGGFVTREEKKAISATVKKFNDLAINGDAATPGEFNGLDVLVTGTTTEYSPLVAIDMSTMAAINTNWEAFAFTFNEFLATLDGDVNAALINKKIFPIVTQVARKLGVYSLTTNDLGLSVAMWGDIPLIDMGMISGSNTVPVIPIVTRTLTAGETTGLTDIYVVRLADDGFHGVSPDDKSKLIRTYEPDITRPGAVHLGEVEIVATVAAEKSTSVGVYRNVKVNP